MQRRLTYRIGAGLDQAERNRRFTEVAFAAVRFLDDEPAVAQEKPGPVADPVERVARAGWMRFGLEGAKGVLASAVR
jgi:hypothetical protein